MDVMMPGLDGYETTRQIRGRWPEIKVVGVSANVFEEAERKAYECGMSAYVRKPYKELELLHTLGEMLSVVYRYEDDPASGEVVSTATEGNLKPDLSLLAVEQVAALRQAASYGDYYHLLELLAAIGADNEGPLAEAVHCMRERVAKYDYEGLEKLLEAGEAP